MDWGSIAPNLFFHPGMPRFAAILSELDSHADSLGAFALVKEMHDQNMEGWPYAERIVIITRLPLIFVEAKLSPLKPDGVWIEEREPRHPGEPELPNGMHRVMVWWD